METVQLSALYQLAGRIASRKRSVALKIYIAGKITGDRKYKDKFREAAKTLEALGHVVLNPAILPAGLEERDYMQITLAMLEAADLAVFLPDYQESAGAMIEWAWCKRTGKDCALYLDMKGGGVG